MLKYSPTDSAAISAGSASSAWRAACSVCGTPTRAADGLVDLGHQALSPFLASRSDVPGRHQVDRDLPVELRRRTLRDHAAEVEHDDPVGDLEDVVHVVGDEQRRVALLGEPAREVEHHPRLGDAERRGRLVHDHELRVPEHGLRDRHRLPLAARERRDRLADRAHGRHREAGERLRRRPSPSTSSSRKTRRFRRSRPRNMFCTMSRLLQSARSW